MHIVLICHCFWCKVEFVAWIIWNPALFVHQLTPFTSFFQQYWEGVKDTVTSAHHPWYRGRGDRLLSWPRPVWALSQGCGAPLGGGSWSQRHWALQSVPGEATTLHQPGPGCTACLRNKQQPLCVCMNETLCVCEWVWVWMGLIEKEVVSMFAKYGWEIDLKRMCDFCHICVSLKQHTLRLIFQHNLSSVSCFKSESVF